MMKPNCPYGTNRVITPKNVLPQAAKTIDNTMTIYDNELLLDVITLNIDSASFTQIKQACNSDVALMEEMIHSIVQEKGKMQNPVTGSGGMLIGKIKEIGSNFPDQTLQVGELIATLVSLSLTPLQIEAIKTIHLDTDQVDITGQAIVFETGIYAKLPSDLPPNVALAALDVAGAPAQVKNLVNVGDVVTILGAAGKSGVLCCYQAKQEVSITGTVIGVVYNETEKKHLEALNLCDEVVVADATDAIDVYNKIKRIAPERSDVTINVVNVENTEMASILATKDEGIVYFFSMATSFTKAALGAEGIGSDVRMIIGNGYTKHHAEITLDIIRNEPKIQSLFKRLYT